MAHLSEERYLRRFCSRAACRCANVRYFARRPMERRDLKQACQLLFKRLQSRSQSSVQNSVGYSQFRTSFLWGLFRIPYTLLFIRPQLYVRITPTFCKNLGHWQDTYTYSDWLIRICGVHLNHVQPSFSVRATSMQPSHYLRTTLIKVWIFNRLVYQCWLCYVGISNDV